MAIFRRASRCFCHETIVSCLRVRRENSEGEERVVGERKEKKSGTKDRRWLTRREGSSQHFFFVFTSARKRRSRDQKTDDRGRSKIQRRSPRRSGEDNVTNEMKFWRLPRSYSLKYARHYCREKEENEEDT